MWKTILPVGTRDRKFGKWSPSWEGPYKVVGIVPGNSYFVQTLQGGRLSKALNGRYLKNTILACGRKLEDVMADTLL